MSEQQPNSVPPPGEVAVLTLDNVRAAMRARRHRTRAAPPRAFPVLVTGFALVAMYFLIVTAIALNALGLMPR